MKWWVIAILPILAIALTSISGLVRLASASVKRGDTQYSPSRALNDEGDEDDRQEGVLEKTLSLVKASGPHTSQPYARMDSPQRTEGVDKKPKGHLPGQETVTSWISGGILAYMQFLQVLDFDRLNPSMEDAQRQHSLD